jgi:hypothetical protein
LKVGLVLPKAGQQATKNIIHMAKTSEQEGLNSLWAFERPLWPLKLQTPYPATPDGSLPIEYQNIFDPIETLRRIETKITLRLYFRLIQILQDRRQILMHRICLLPVKVKGSH